jgi:hypothetical protein
MAADGEEAPEGEQAARETANTFLDAAQRFLEPPPTPRLVAVGGLSGAGKTALGGRLAPLSEPAPGALHVRSDDIRKRLAGVTPEDRLPREAYTPETSAAVYRRVLDDAGLALLGGYSVLLDGVFARPQAIIITLVVIASVWVAMRLKGDRPSLEGRAHEDSVLTRKPQVLMTAALIVLTGLVFYDAMQQKYLALIFPAGVSIFTFAPLSVVLVQQLRGREGGSAFHDNDLSLSPGTPGLFHYLLWIFRLLAGIYVVGLPIAIWLFIFVFTTVKAGRKYLRNAALAVGLLSLVSVLTELLTLRYPPGLIQRFIDMPWWLGS